MDAKLIDRISLLLETNSFLAAIVAKGQVVSAGTVADVLRQTYPEYKRKKEKPFVKTVQQATDICFSQRNKHFLAKKKSQKTTDRDSESSFSEDNSSYRQYEDSNSMNKSLNSMYQNPKKRKVDSPAFSGNGQKNIFSLTNKTVVDSPEGTIKEKATKSINDEETKMAPKTSGVVHSKSESDLKKLALVKKSMKSSQPSEEFELSTSHVTFDDIGGNESIVEDLVDIFTTIVKPRLCKKLHCTSPRGFLLHGPSGCGKTLLAWAMAGELNLPILALPSNKVIAGISGESEGRIRDIFNRAMSTAPCVLFFDNIDVIAQGKSGSSRAMEDRVVSQLCTCLDELRQKAELLVLVVATTHNPHLIHASLRCPGRFDDEINLQPPDENARKSILQTLCNDMPVEGIDFDRLAYLTPGYVGGDLVELRSRAARLAVKRLVDKEISQLRGESRTPDDQTASIVEAGSDKNEFTSMHNSKDSLGEVQIKGIKSEAMEVKRQFYRTIHGQESEDSPDVSITMSDFLNALDRVLPSAKRQGFATIPDVTWEDVGALKEVRTLLHKFILLPVRRAAQFKKRGMNRAKGVLLYGPPGCGKTMVAKAISNEAGLNFISVAGPELFSMYQGESERNVRQLFDRAKNTKPCLVFFDEIDSLGSTRFAGHESGSRRDVVTQLLTKMDGVEGRDQVYLMAATNKLDLVDPALLRPGRFDQKVFVGLPEYEDRLDILQTITRKRDNAGALLASDIDLEEAASQCERFTGADLQYLIDTAFSNAVVESESVGKQDSDDDWGLIYSRHVTSALTEIKPSVTEQELKRYKSSVRESTVKKS